MSKSLFKRGFPILGIVMVVATITLAGLVAFQFLDAQDNTEVAVTNTPQTTEVATVKTVEDVETITTELEQAEAELNTLDQELSTEFNF